MFSIACDDSSEVFADVLAGLGDGHVEALRRARLVSYVVMGSLPLQCVRALTRTSAGDDADQNLRSLHAFAGDPCEKELCEVAAGTAYRTV